MADIGIAREDDGRRGRYVARIAGIEAEAELTFTHRAPGVISADHTGAPEIMRGTGVAAALVDRLVEDARSEGFKIVPMCSYVGARYAKHPEWRDVMTSAPGEKPDLRL